MHKIKSLHPPYLERTFISLVGCTKVQLVLVGHKRTWGTSKTQNPRQLRTLQLNANTTLCGANMTKSSAAKLLWQKKYNAQPEQQDKRVANNRARREAIREGRPKVGDGKDIGHKKPMDAGGDRNAKSNLQVQDRKDNRGWRKDHPGIYGKK